ncbi:MAG: hypothetical protein A2340_00850 [Lentisphaerae bacterium RIFOXYB12_FULL_60_10]|nr:MAG: hypothetical protein A2340_00850 [Lentisphaerae bacterium RIFOXYB12_FULL_60_10]
MRQFAYNRYFPVMLVLLTVGVFAYGRVYWALGRSADVMRQLQSQTPVQPFETRVRHNGDNRSFSLFTLGDPLAATLAHIRAAFPDAAIAGAGGAMTVVYIPSGNRIIRLLALANEPTDGTLVFMLDAASSTTIPADASDLPSSIPAYPGADYRFAATLEINGTTLVQAETTDNSSAVAHHLEAAFRLNGWIPRLPVVSQTDAFQVYERSDALCCLTITRSRDRSTTRIAWLHKPRSVK